MCLVVNLLQPLRRDVRVDLRRGQTRMAEQLLDAAQIRTVLQQVRGETVPKTVRTDRPGQAAERDVLLQEPVHLAHGDAAALLADEDGVGHLELLGPPGQVGLDGLEGRRADRAQTLFLPLAAHHDRAGNIVDILKIQADEFADPDAGGVERFQQGPVAQAKPLPRNRTAQQLDDLPLIQEAGKTLRRQESLRAIVRLEMLAVLSRTMNCRISSGVIAAILWWPTDAKNWSRSTW